MNSARETFMKKMTKDCYHELEKIINKHITPMYFNTGLPILCIVNSEVSKMLKEIKKDLVEE